MDSAGCKSNRDHGVPRRRNSRACRHRQRRVRLDRAEPRPPHHAPVAVDDAYSTPQGVVFKFRGVV